MPDMADSQKDETPRKDWWDKADIVGKWVVALVIALAGWWIQNVLTAQSTGKDYIAISLVILERKDLPADMQKNKGLREWAVKLLNNYSSAKLDDTTMRDLTEGETRIPIAQGLPPRQPTIAELQAASSYSILRMSNDKSMRVSVNGQGEVKTIQAATGGGGGFSSNITLPQGLVISPDNHHFAVYNDRLIGVWDVAFGINSTRTEQTAEFTIHPSVIASVSFTNDNFILVTDTDGKQTKYTLTGSPVTQ